MSSQVARRIYESGRRGALNMSSEVDTRLYGSGRRGAALNKASDIARKLSGTGRRPALNIALLRHLFYNDADEIRRNFVAPKDVTVFHRLLLAPSSKVTHSHIERSKSSKDYGTRRG